MKKQVEKLPNYSLFRFEKKSSYEHIDNYPIVYLIQVQEWCITKMRYVIYATKDDNSIEKVRNKDLNIEKNYQEYNSEIQKIIVGKGGKEYSVITDQHEAYLKFIFYGEQNNYAPFMPSLPSRPTESFELLKSWYAKVLKADIERNKNESIDKNVDEDIVIEKGLIDTLLSEHKMLCEPKTSTGAWRLQSEIIANKKFVQWLEERKKELEQDEAISENILPAEKLEKISHRIVLLHELGIIDLLKKERKDLNETYFAQLIGTLIGVIEKEKVETIRKNLAYINVKHRNNPINNNSTNAVKSLLAKYGIGLKRLKD